MALVRRPGTLGRSHPRDRSHPRGRAVKAVLPLDIVQLLRARLVGLGPFEDATFALGESSTKVLDSEPDPASVMAPLAYRPRLATVVIGGAGSGKTSFLSAIATTRPGHAVAQLTSRNDGASPGYVVADWLLGDDDEARPHPLRVVSPNAKADDTDEQSLVRRKEQALFDRRSAEGGFVFLAFSGARWFSRTPVTLATPDRTLLRYDVRATSSFDDASRADLTRETKQALSYSAIGAALISRASETFREPARNAGDHMNDHEASLLARAMPHEKRLLLLSSAMDSAVAAALWGSGFTYRGIDPARLEPVFSEAFGPPVLFDDLPRGLRHAIAFCVLSLRALAAAYPTRDPRTSQGIVLIDDAESQLPISQQRTLIPRLLRALPRVQWVLATASPAIAEGAEIEDVIAIRRLPGSAKVELFEGGHAMLH